MIDQAARARVAQLQANKSLHHGISKLTSAIEQSSVVAKPQPKTPTTELADELRSLQKLIGGGNLTTSLQALATSLDGFDVNENALGQLKTLVTDLSAKLRLLAEVEAKLPKDINLNFPEEVQVVGTVNVATVKELPPVSVTNFSDVTMHLAGLFSSLQTAVIGAIAASKTEIPSQIQVGNEVKIAEFKDLLDGIEELKNGFNILINKEAAIVGFPTTAIPVEIQNWHIPQPVTHVSINGLRGETLASAVTVTNTLTPLPATALANRRSLVLYNNSASTTIYIGGANVTPASGVPVPAGAYAPAFDASATVIIYGITATGSADIRVLEMSDEGAGA